MDPYHDEEPPTEPETPPSPSPEARSSPSPENMASLSLEDQGDHNSPAAPQVESLEPIFTSHDTSAQPSTPKKAPKNRSWFQKFKTNGTAKKSSLRLDIGTPIDFRHLSHVGGRNGVFQLDTVDPNAKAFFDKVGIAERKLAENDLLPLPPEIPDNELPPPPAMIMIADNDLPPPPPPPHPMIMIDDNDLPPPPPPMFADNDLPPPPPIIAENNLPSPSPPIRPQRRIKRRAPQPPPPPPRLTSLYLTPPPSPSTSKDNLDPTPPSSTTSSNLTPPPPPSGTSGYLTLSPPPSVPNRYSTLLPHTRIPSSSSSNSSASSMVPIPSNFFNPPPPPKLPNKYFVQQASALPSPGNTETGNCVRPPRRMKARAPQKPMNQTRCHVPTPLVMCTVLNGDEPPLPPPPPTPPPMPMSPPSPSTWPRPPPPINYSDESEDEEIMAAEENCRLDLIRQIQRGVSLRKVVASSPVVLQNSAPNFSNCLDQIRNGVALKKVEIVQKAPESPEENDGMSGALVRALAQRSRAIHSESATSEDEIDGIEDGEEWV